MFICARVSLMCVSPLWPPLICQGILVRVAVSSIHICASAQRLNICHWAQSNRECNKQKMFCVYLDDLHMKHRHCFVSVKPSLSLLHCQEMHLFWRISYHDTWMNIFSMCVSAALPGFEALMISRTKCPLNPACRMVAALTSFTVGCLSLQFSGGFVSAST